MYLAATIQAVDAVFDGRPGGCRRTTRVMRILDPRRPPQPPPLLYYWMKPPHLWMFVRLRVIGSVQRLVHWGHTSAMTRMMR